MKRFKKKVVDRFVWNYQFSSVTLKERAMKSRKKHTVISSTPLPVFGVRVSMTFHLMCVHIIFSSVSIAEWPPFGK